MLLAALVASSTVCSAHGAVDRLERIAQHLDEERDRVVLWSRSWAGGYSALAAGNAVVAGVTKDPGLRTDSLVNASALVVGATFVAALPLPVVRDAPQVRSTVQALPPGGEWACRALPAAEEALERNAHMEQLGKSWPMHVLAAAFNLGVGAVLGVGYGRWPTAVFSTVVGIGLGEAQIWTQPDGSAAFRRELATPAPRLEEASSAP